MKKLFLFIFLSAFMFGCTEHDIAYTTFKGELVYTFLQKDSTYSEYLKVLDKAGLKGLLTTYREYTCFAPTNTAMRKYYRSLGSRFTIDSLRKGQIDTLARMHIVPSRHNTFNFRNGVLPDYNINYQFVEVNFDTIVGEIRLNGSSRIISKDNDVSNGVVHGIDKVFDQPIAQLPALMSRNKDISIFTQALFLTHLSDSMNLIADARNKAPLAYYSDYTDVYLSAFPYSPQRKFGYTAFVEDNDLLEANGIRSLADLIQRAKKIYPCDSRYDNDFVNRNNSLNRYIAYHLINKAIYSNRFFYARNAIQGYTPDEFLETMLPNRIIRVAYINAQVILNPGTDYTAHVREIDNQRSLNGVYHLLDHMLVYTEQVERMLQNTRIRFDIASLFPELTNNNIRGTNTQMMFSNAAGTYFCFDPGYLTNVKASETTQLIYGGGIEGRGDHFPYFQTDICHAVGFYDITIRLLPVPPGTYELRFGTRSQSTITQIYVDNKPVGIPICLFRLDNKSIGSLLDTETDDNGVKNDQLLRDKGYMKAPTSFWYRQDTKEIARDQAVLLRKIVGIFSFTDYQAHTIRFKSVVNYDSKLLLDYFELVPKAVFAPPGGEYESRD